MDTQKLPQQILTMQQLTQFYQTLQKKCQQLQDYQDPGLSIQTLIQKYILAQKYITNQSLFSQNQKLKQIHTQHLRFLTLPYYLGMLYGRINNPRKQAILQSKNYLQAYLSLLQTFNSQQQQIFPTNIYKTWKQIKQTNDYNISRDQIIANYKQKKIIQSNYKHHLQIKDHFDQRLSIKNFIKLKLYQSISQIKSIVEQFQILKYKESLDKNPQEKKKHDQEFSKPIPKIKIWEIKKSQEIHQCMCPQKNSGQQKMEKIAQVWQQNPNKPTITLQQVAQMQIDNMRARQQRQKKYRQQNQVDTDSDKQQVDDRQKKQARAWDDWKDAHQKGAGNKGNR